LRSSAHAHAWNSEDDGDPVDARRPLGAVAPSETAQLTVVVPTRNEAENVDRLVAEVSKLKDEIDLELVFADDSDDDTVERIEAAAESASVPIRFIHRDELERGSGLGGAVVEAASIAASDWVCVMDGDLQHPPGTVRDLVEERDRLDADVVIGTRYRPGGSAGGLGPLRLVVSKVSGLVTRILFPRSVGRVSDPMSGFFLARRRLLTADGFRPRGFKILLELLVKSGPLRVSEVPYSFQDRADGESNADANEGARFIRQLWNLRVRSSLSSRLGAFAAVGVTGIAVNLGAVWALTELFGLHYLLSAILATQLSTGWNFWLSDALVFSGRTDSLSSRSRIARFYGMNNAAFAVRGPLIVALTAGLGVHYLASTLASLVLLSGARFALSSTWIWRDAEAKDSMKKHRYDIHGVMAVVSDVALPELASMETSEPDGPVPAITVTRGRIRNAGDLEVFRFKEILGWAGFATDVVFGLQTRVGYSPLLGRSPHVLYTNVVEPLLRWHLVERGYALAHGACLGDGGRAVMVTARTDTGKTTTALKLLQKRPLEFLSDDLTLLDERGQILSYTKPLTVSSHTVAALAETNLNRWERFTLPLQSRIHSRGGRKFAFFLAKTHLPVATINTIIQLLIPPPKYSVQRLVPGSRIGARASLEQLIVIERAEADQEVTLSGDAAVEVLRANSADAFGFPPYSELEAYLLAQRPELRAREAEIIEMALEGLPATALRRVSMDWAERIGVMLDAGTPAAAGKTEAIQATDERRVA
jgi:putative flippase GtrA